MRLFFTKLTSDSMKFWSPLGMSLPIRPANVSVRKTRRQAIHIEITALEMEMSMLPIFNGMITWGWRCSIRFIDGSSSLNGFLDQRPFTPKRTGCLPYRAGRKTENKGDQGRLKMNLFYPGKAIKNEAGQRQPGNKSSKSEGNGHHFERRDDLGRIEGGGKKIKQGQTDPHDISCKKRSHLNPF